MKRADCHLEYPFLSLDVDLGVPINSLQRYIALSFAAIARRRSSVALTRSVCRSRRIGEDEGGIALTLWYVSIPFPANWWWKVLLAAVMTKRRSSGVALPKVSLATWNADGYLWWINSPVSNLQIWAAAALRGTQEEIIIVDSVAYHQSSGGFSREAGFNCVCLRFFSKTWRLRVWWERRCIINGKASDILRFPRLLIATFRNQWRVLSIYFKLCRV